MKVNVQLVVAQTLGVFALLAVCLFFSAGTLAWPAGWAFWGLFLSFFVGTAEWLYRQNPGFLQERLHLETADEENWDKALFTVLQVAFLGCLVFSSLDGGRDHWSAIPVWVQAGGTLILLASFFLFILSFRENPYLSPVVRIQSDRGQTLISTGPFGHLRHPMYSAILVFLLGTTLLLGSAYGLLLDLVPSLLLAGRTVLEERTLVGQLPGYADYQSRVRYRLIPHVW